MILFIKRTENTKNKAACVEKHKRDYMLYTTVDKLILSNISLQNQPSALLSYFLLKEQKMPKINRIIAYCKLL